MIRIKDYENEDVLKKYMPSLTAVNSFFENGNKNLAASSSVINNYQNSNASENYHENILQKYENFENRINNVSNELNNKALSENSASEKTEIYNNSYDKVSEKEKVFEKSESKSQTYLNEYRDSQKVLEKSGDTTVNIDMTGMQNNITSTNDIDEFISQITTRLETAMNSSASGVHI
ncbi:MAG: hypothetical protein R3Y35_02410 [Clostridia bacterium]